MAVPGPAPELSVVIPVFRSGEAIRVVLSSLEDELRALGKTYEIILVEDGSPDRSWEVVREEADGRPAVRAIRLMRNYGQHNALLCGIRAAGGAVIVTMDDDGQHPPEAIPRLLDALDGGADVVYGSPVDGTHGFWRNIATAATKRALQVTIGSPVARRAAAFRAFRTELREAFREYHGPLVSIDVLLAWGTSSFDAVPVRYRQRIAGESGYTFYALVRHALNMLTGFSAVPLRIASFVGFFFTLFGLATLAYVLLRYVIEGGSVPGFPFLASIIAIFSGAQLFALGIIGEYLARMHFRVMDRPAYAIRTVREGGDRARDTVDEGGTG